MQDVLVEESSSALHLIIMQSAVCNHCRANEHTTCTGVGLDIIAGKDITCQCMVCNPEGVGISGD